MSNILSNGDFSSPNLINSNLNLVSASNTIANGLFSRPSITTNSFVLLDNLTQTDRDLFYWIANTYVNSNVSIQRGTTAFNYPPPTGISTQYLSIQKDDYIQQNISLNNIGYYRLSYYYVSRGYPYQINPLNFILNNTTALDSIPSTDVSTWTNRTAIYYNTDTTTNISVPLLIQGQGFGVDKNVAIANVVLSQVFGSTSNLTSTSYNWDISGTVYLVTNNHPNFAYPDPNSLGITQYTSLVNSSSISQNILLTGYGLYTLSFYYASRTSFSFNNLEIYYGGILIDTLTNVVNGTWNLYQKQIMITYSNGIPVLELRGTSSNGQIGIANISFTAPTNPISNSPVYGYINTAVIGATPDLSMNLMNKTSIYGAFTVQNKYASYDNDGNPAGILKEAGDARFYGNITVYGYAKFMNSIDAAGTWSKTGNNICYASGTVGIGNNVLTANILSAPLNVVSANYTNIEQNGIYCYNNNNTQNCIIATKTGSSGGNPIVGMDASGATNGGWCIGVDRGDASKFKIANTNNRLAVNTKATIDVNGNVGILTTTPSYTLDVNGSMNCSTFQTGTSNTNSLNLGRTTYPSTNTLSITPNNGLEIFWNKVIVGNGMTDFLNKSQNAGGTDKGGFTFNTVNSSFTPKTLFYSSDQQFYINTNVAINKTSPTVSLDVSGSINASGNISCNSLSYANPSNYFYKTNIITPTTIVSNTSYSFQINSLPAGLYIISYSVKLINPSVGLTTTVSRFIGRIETINTSTSAVVSTILNDRSFASSVIPVNSNYTTYSNTISYINTGTYHLKLTFSPVHNNELSYGFNSESLSSFLQAQKIG